MRTVQRILDAVTIRQVFVALLIGGFAKEITTFITWLAGTGRGLAGVSSVRGLLMAALALAFDAACVYLALRGLGWALGQRRRSRSPIAAEEAERQAESSAGLSEDSAAAGAEAASWPREGGGNGYGPDHC